MALARGTGICTRTEPSRISTYSHVLGLQRGGINDAGVIATTLLGIPGSPGVVWDHGILTQVNYPGADYSYVYGTNNRGDLVGIDGAGDLICGPTSMASLAQWCLRRQAPETRSTQSTMPIASWGRTRISLASYIRSWGSRFQSQPLAVWL